VAWIAKIAHLHVRLLGQPAALKLFVRDEQSRLVGWTEEEMNLMSTALG
jgi:hypothetical protein